MPLQKESGFNWEIRRGHIDPVTAQIAGRQAHWLYRQGQTDWFRISIFPLLKVSTVRGIKRCDVLSWPSVSDEVYEPIKTLVELASTLAEETGDTSGKSLINIYEMFGVIGMHRDHKGIANAPLKDQTEAVGLSGVARVSIKDAEGFEGSFDIHPTDTVYFNNPILVEERAWHSFKNIGNGPRIALVD